MHDSLLGHDEAAMLALVNTALSIADDRKLRVAVGISENGGHDVTASGGRAETMEATHSLRLSVRVFAEGRRGSATTGDVSHAGMAAAIDHAALLSRYGDVDRDADLADREMLAWNGPRVDVHHPSGLGAADVAERAIAIEQAARSRHGVLVQRAGFSVGEHCGATANSHGFARGWSSSWVHGMCGVAAGDGDQRQSDYVAETVRRLVDFPDAEAIGGHAADLARARVGSRAAPGGSFPVLFEARVAGSLVSEIVGGLSGGAQFRRATFLADALGRQVTADHLSLHEDPFDSEGMATRPFDGAGVQGQVRAVLKDGVATGYFLDVYAARRLGMGPTGNGDGPGNLYLSSDRTAAGDDRAAMLRKIGTGLFVTGLSGEGVNPITGDYSRAATGFWVEGGAIAYPVAGVTIAGSLPQMLLGIQAVGADLHRGGAITTGSILIDAMTVAS